MFRGEEALPFGKLIDELGRKLPKAPAPVAELAPAPRLLVSFSVDWALAPFSLGWLFVLIWKCGCRGADCSRKAHTGPLPSPFP